MARGQDTSTHPGRKPVDFRSGPYTFHTDGTHTWQKPGSVKAEITPEDRADVARSNRTSNLGMKNYDRRL